MEKEYLEKLQKLETEFSERIKALREDVRANKTTAFEVGKWYTITDGNGVCLFNHQNSGNSYGFTEDGWLKGNWYTGAEYFLNDAPRVRQATDKEIEEALIKEAEKRGFKSGAFIENTNGVAGTLGRDFSGGTTEYWSASDRLVYLGAFVYDKGRWAKVKEKEVTMAGYPVKYYKEHIEINGYCFTKGLIENIASLLMVKQIKSLNVGCTGQYKVSHEDAKNILDNWK